jgi:hypothetical protein
MSESKGRFDLHGLYGALLGGLMASFVGMAAFWLLSVESVTVTAFSTLIATLAGMTCAIGFMVGGLCSTERLPWLGGALLFASGFTTLWAVAVSFADEPRWAVLVALGVAIAMGVFLGWWRFGREPGTAATGRENVAWIR